MHQQIRSAKYRARIAVAALALAILGTAAMDSTSANAAGYNYKWVGKYSLIDYYMCKSSPTAVRLLGYAGSTVTGMYFRVEGISSGFSYWSYGAKVAWNKGNSSSVTVYNPAGSTVINVRRIQYNGNVAFTGPSQGISTTGLPNC